MEYNYKNKSSWKLILLCVVLGTVVYGLVFFLSYPKYWGYRGNLQYPISNTQNETAGWKTYRNDKYGFEIKYPTYLSITSIDYKDQNDLVKNNIDSNYDFGNLLLNIDYIIVNNKSDNLVCAQYQVQVEKTGYKNINQWAENLQETIETPSEYEGQIISGKLTSVEDLEIQNEKAKIITIEGGFPFFTGKFGIIDNNKIYSINYLDMSSEGDRKCANNGKDYKNVFNKMISTFKFTK